jgi:acid phosphatase/tartrate-resistant acid phosphatase type 5
MQVVAEGLGPPRFVLALGDNFYDKGISGSEYSTRFQTTFEQAFPEPGLQCPWYAVAGNHDHHGNVTAQIKYSDHSKRWRFPDLHYTFSQPVIDGGVNITTQVIYIDTVTIAGMSYRDDATGAFVEGEAHPLQRLAQTQLTWLEDTLKASTADYLWVAGHYPVYSHCQHGPTAKLILQVLPLLQKYKASGYIAGHDHCSAHYDHDDLAFVVTGAGKACCYKPDNLKAILNPGPPAFRMDSEQSHGAAGGFASFAVTAQAHPAPRTPTPNLPPRDRCPCDLQNTTIRYHSDNGTVLFSATPVAPRNA